MATNTFIVDCPSCSAKVAAEISGVAERSGRDYETGEPFANRLYVGKCLHCHSLLAGECYQMAFAGFDAEFDEWSAVVRVFPKPPRTFSSNRIPRTVSDSLFEADRSLQGNAPTAACVMFGRALEALCRDILERAASPSARRTTAPAKKKKVMLAEGIRKLKDGGFIDQRLYDWSQQLHAFRNIAAHPDDVSISRQDAEDLQTFAYAIVEYIYDLADRYEEFKQRVDRRKKKSK